MAGLLRRYKSPIYGNYRKRALLYGSLTGGVMFVFVVAYWLFGTPMATPENYVTDLVMAVCIFVASYHYRKYETEGKIFFKELMLVGLTTGLIASIIYGLLLMVYAVGIDVDFCSRCIQERVNLMPQETEAEIEAVNMTMRYTNGDWAFIGFFRSAVMMIIIVFFAAIIFRTEQNVRR